MDAVGLDILRGRGRQNERRQEEEEEETDLSETLGHCVHDRNMCASVRLILHNGNQTESGNEGIDDKMH